jgi:hypothetical protein
MPARSNKIAVAVSAGEAFAELDTLIAAATGRGQGGSKVDKTLKTLDSLATKEAIPIAIVGGLAAIHHGYQRFTKDVDVVVGRKNLDPIVRVAPQYGIKVIWHDPRGWHKLSYEGVSINVVPEGAAPAPGAPNTMPSPKHLGVSKGTGYANLAGWIETKLASNRIQDRADIVQVMKKTDSARLAKVRDAVAKLDSSYLRRFNELQAAAEEEKAREAQRGGPR